MIHSDAGTNISPSLLAAAADIDTAHSSANSNSKRYFLVKRRSQGCDYYVSDAVGSGCELEWTEITGAETMAQAMDAIFTERLVNGMDSSAEVLQVDKAAPVNLERVLARIRREQEEEEQQRTREREQAEYVRLKARFGNKDTMGNE